MIYTVNVDIEIEANNPAAAEDKVLDQLQKLDEVYITILGVKEIYG